MTKKMTPALALLVVLLSPQLEACADSESPYPIKESGMHAEDAPLAWVDNERIIFHGYKLDRTGEKSPHDRPQVIERALYLWDVQHGTVTKYLDFVGQTPICVNQGAVHYFHKGLLMSGKLGEEQGRRLPEKRWFNPHSCRYYDTRPWWVLMGHETRPLMEEHGFLDFGEATGRPATVNTPIVFHPQGAKNSVKLPVGRQELRFGEIIYAPFKRAYLMYTFQYYDETAGGQLPTWPKNTPHPVWWLSPDGTVTKEEVPYLPLLRGGYHGFVPTQRGLLLVSHNARKLFDPGDAGAYLFEKRRFTKILTGMLSKTAVSPNGCKVATVFDPYVQKPVVERITLRVVDFCSEKGKSEQ